MDTTASTSRTSKMKPQKYNLPIPWNRHYAKHKHKASSKGQEWAFTHETWYKIWQDSGVMQYRGRRVHEYCMVRLDPIEAWGPHNCMIVTRRRWLQKSAYESIHRYPASEWHPRHGYYVPPETKERYNVE